MLSTFKQSLNMPHSYAEEGPSFLEGLHTLDSQRLDKIKRELLKQTNDNYLQLSVLFYLFSIEKSSRTKFEKSKVLNRPGTMRESKKCKQKVVATTKKSKESTNKI